MIPSSIYEQRREKLKSSFRSGILIFFGNTEIPMNYPANPYPFRQDSHFLYFFGIDRPDVNAIIDIDNGREIVFGDEATIDDIIWMGQHETIKSLAARSSIMDVQPSERFTKYIDDVSRQKKKIHYLPPYPAERIIRLAEVLHLSRSEVVNNVSVDFIKAVASLREIKDEFEISQMEQTLSDITGPAHVAAMKMALEGRYEYEISGEFISHGYRNDLREAYPVICSVRGEVLHNHIHKNQLKKDQLLLIDAGFESPLHYATDITRTTPVNGKFTKKQNEIYEIVLNALNSSILNIKPGIAYMAIHLKACEIIATGLKELGIMKGDPAEAVENGAHALFLPHGLGHLIGLDVHDMEDLGEDNYTYSESVKRSTIFGTKNLRLGKQLKKGFTLTVEPGIYFIPALIEQWRSENRHKDFIDYQKLTDYFDFGGIRIEDNILVTEKGAKILGKPIPKSVQDIENLF